MTKLIGKVVSRGDDLEIAYMARDAKGNLIILSPWSLTYIEGVISEAVPGVSAFPHLNRNPVCEDD